jgi:hypothetical protein
VEEYAKLGLKFYLAITSCLSLTMEISEFTLKLILLLIPGAMASLIFVKLTTHTKWNSFKFIAHSILFGALSYLAAVLIFRGDVSLHSFWNNLSIKEIPYGAIWKAAIVAVFIGFLAAAIDTYKVINKIGRYLKLSNKYGDMSAYSLLLNARNVEEIYFRDFANNLTYHGIIDSFAETETYKELILRGVKVYSLDTADFLYNLDKVYLCREGNQCTIEVPVLKK